jgi:hypothetical protein
VILPPNRKLTVTFATWKHSCINRGNINERDNERAIKLLFFTKNVWAEIGFASLESKLRILKKLNSHKNKLGSKNCLICLKWKEIYDID